MLITITTDFGLDDAYVAIMKGVILGIAPHARIVDYTHGVQPGNIASAAYLIQSGVNYFPPGTVHLAVVDPGVGSDRRALAIGTPEATFVGPDNGLFAPVVQAAQARWPDQVVVVQLDQPRFWLPQVSNTFHGRDIFAPVAAHLINGTPLEALGSHVDQVAPLRVPQPQVRDGALYGQIIHVDRFGNCITNLVATDLAAHGIDQHFMIEISDQQIPGLFRTYSDGPIGVPMALLGSSGHVEIAVRNGSAAQMLGVSSGDRLRVRLRESPMHGQ